jgi:hypothetical protein
MAITTDQRGATFDAYGQLPELIRNALDELVDFIGDLDGKTICTATNGGDAFIDEGTIDASDAVKAFNVIVAALALRAALPQAQAETVNAIERSLVRQIVLSCTPGEGVQYRLRERMLAEIDKLPILDAVPVIAEERADG